MSKVLEVSPSTLSQMAVGEGAVSALSHQGMLVDQAVLDRFYQLGPYLEMLNRAVSIKDEELISHIAGKLSEVFTFSSQLKAINN
jgi:hypothetical protein